MKIAVPPPRHRRLLLLCGLSACVHLLLLELAARQGPTPARQSAPAPLAAPLALRLAPAAGPASVAALPAVPGQAAPATPVSAARARPARPRPAEPAPAPSRATAPTTATAAAPAPAPAPEHAPPPAAAAAVAAPMIAGAAPYRAELPAPARLAYRRQDGGADVPPAYLDWRFDDNSYTLELDGILGRLSSSGTRGDGGMVPARASDTVAGRRSAARFDADTGEIVFEDGGGRFMAPFGVQDGASLLVQLAALGRAAPEQFQNPLRFVVAVAGGIGIVRFELVGEEQVETGVGTLAAWHLAQLAPAGQARLDLWLAPSQDWLPVRLRLTRADGSVATQVLASAARGAARP